MNYGFDGIVGFCLNNWIGEVAVILCRISSMIPCHHYETFKIR